MAETTPQLSRPIEPHASSWRKKLYTIIFEAETPLGKLFDVALLWIILASVITVMLESVWTIRQSHGALLRSLEWIFTVLFTIEYVLRCISVKCVRRYVFSFFGVIDLMAVVPTYLSLLLPGAQLLLVIRALRLLRIFRILKLVRYVSELNIFLRALKNSRDKVVVFLMIIMTSTAIFGTLMYLLEGATHGFTSIPRSIYWCIVTMTTVGYGDIAPETVPGQILASIIMILGYAIIVIPTGIFSVELARSSKNSSDSCPHCGKSLK